MTADELSREIKRRNLTLREAGRWCGVSRSYLCRLRRGHVAINEERATLIRLGLTAYDRMQVR